MKNEGVIKFRAIQKDSNLISDQEFLDINKWRTILFNLKQIGVYKEGEFAEVGYGNISIRTGNSFIISGSATGCIENLTNQHYTRVIGYDIENNMVYYDGPIAASSETMTHAAVYESDLDVNAIIHAHNLGLWNKLLNKVPTTKFNVTYGTPEMAKEIMRLFKETKVQKEKLLVMAGHKEGIITFGKNLNEAGESLLKHLKS